MNAEQLIRIYQTCRYKCLRTASSYWVFMGGSSALNVPTLENVFPARAEIKQVFANGARAVRFCTEGPWTPQAYEFILRHMPYDFAIIKQKARNQTRRGLERCEIRAPSESDLMQRALEINRQTLRRQRRRNAVLFEKTLWQRYVSLLLTLPDVMAYAAYVDSVMVAHVLVYVIENKIVLYHPFMDRAYSKHYPMNALVYSAINQTRDKVGPLPVSYGFGSIWNIDSLDHFKLGMGFEKLPRLRITLFSGIVRPAINPTLAKLVQRVPVLGGRIGPKYRRLVEEKGLGVAWWRNPTTRDAASESLAK